MTELDPAETERRAQAARDEQARLARFLIEKWETWVPPRYRNARLADAQQDTQKLAAGWLADPARNVTVAGPVGTGKTHTGWALLRAAAEHGHSTYGICVVDLMHELRPPVNTEIERRVREIGVLLLDDLGAERDSAWVAEQFYRIVNHRWDHELPTIVTTNLGRKALGEAIGERAASRLFDDSLIIKLAERNHRKDQN